MALTPKQAQGNKPDRLKRRVEELEQSFDLHLAAKFNGRTSVTLSLPYNEDDWVVEQLEERYSAAGWNTEIKKIAGDFRDPGYIHFIVTAR